MKRISNKAWLKAAQRELGASMREEYLRVLKRKLSRQRNPKIAALSRSELFLTMVSLEQEREFNPEDGTTILPKLAAARVLERFSDEWNRIERALRRRRRQ